EWRKDTLKKEGQEEQEIKASRGKKRIGFPAASKGGIDQSIDSLDGEGDIGSMFDGALRYDTEESSFKPNDNSGTSKEVDQIKTIPVSKQYLQLNNYASLDCAASILKANTEAQGASAILSENKDYYMLNKCAAEKFIIVELCEDILISSFV